MIGHEADVAVYEEQRATPTNPANPDESIRKTPANPANPDDSIRKIRNASALENFTDDQEPRTLPRRFDLAAWGI